MSGKCNFNKTRQRGNSKNKQIEWVRSKLSVKTQRQKSYKENAKVNEDFLDKSTGNYREREIL